MTRPRYRWKDGKDKELMEFVGKRVEAGVAVTTALKEFGDANDISWLTARWKYYQMRRNEKPVKDVALPKTSQAQAPPDDDFLGHLADFVNASNDLGTDVVPLVRGLSRMARLSKEAMALRRQLAMSEDELRQERQKASDAKADLDKTAARYLDLCALLERWLNLSQVDKVAGLKEFASSVSCHLEKTSTTS